MLQIITTVFRRFCHFILRYKHDDSSVENINKQSLYTAWLARYNTLSDDDRTLIRKRVESMQRKPLVSVVLTKNDQRFFEETFESVSQQIYPDWELVIVSTRTEYNRISQTTPRLGTSDPRIKVLFIGTTISHQGLNFLLSNCHGEYFVIIEPGDILSEHALYILVESIQYVEGQVLVYGDHDFINENGKHSNPNFKPDWNHDLLLSGNYIMNSAMLHRNTALELIGSTKTDDSTSNDIEAILYDMYLRISERYGPSQITHTAFLILSKRTSINEEDSQTHKMWQSAINTYFKRRGIPAKAVDSYGPHQLRRICFDLDKPEPSVSIIIPTKNNRKFLEKCLKSICKLTDYPNFQIVVIFNGDDTDLPEHLEQLLGTGAVQVLHFAGEFNFAAIMNFAVKHVDTKLICLLNDDTEVISRDWLWEMASHAMRPEVGIVGAKLYYPDNTIQHGGIIVGIFGVCGHMHRKLPRFASGYQGLAQKLQNYSAVTAACMVMRRDVFHSIGGMDETNLMVSFNDIDLCLSAQKHGYLVVWTPWAELFHFESGTLGLENIETRRFKREFSYIRKKWGIRLSDDPYYNPNLSLQHEDFRLAFPPRVIRPWTNNNYTKDLSSVQMSVRKVSFEKIVHGGREQKDDEA